MVVTIGLRCTLTIILRRQLDCADARSGTLPSVPGESRGAVCLRTCHEFAHGAAQHPTTLRWFVPSSPLMMRHTEVALAPAFGPAPPPRLGTTGSPLCQRSSRTGRTDSSGKKQALPRRWADGGQQRGRPEVTARSEIFSTRWPLHPAGSDSAGRVRLKAAYN